MAIQLARRLFTVEEFHRMGEAGVFSEDDRVELLDGEIVQMTPIGSRHAACVKRLIRLLDRIVGDRAIVAAQDPIQLGEHSEPQPDLALLKPRPDFYAQAHPGPADVLLLIEVAETSADADREVKLPLYACAGVIEVWLVDLATEQVEIYRTPGPHGYQACRTLRPAATSLRRRPSRISRALWMPSWANARVVGRFDRAGVSGPGGPPVCSWTRRDALWA